MSAQPWLATHGLHISDEIDPDAYDSVVQMLEEAMQRFAGKPAFRCFGQTITYADTDRLSRNFAAYLQHRLELSKGQRVAVMLPNIPAFPIAMIGILRAGAAQVNVNPLYTPRELEHPLNDAGVETIVIFAGSTPTLAEIVTKTAVKRDHCGAGDATSRRFRARPWTRDSRMRSASPMRLPTART
jgi:long-chain acyl-CoA synthetase